MNANPPKNSVTTCLFMALFPLVIVAGLFLFFHARALNRELKSQATAELFDPYFDRVKAGKHADAYQSHTDDAYKKAHSLDDYQRHYTGVVQKYGAISATEIYSVDEKDILGENKRSQAFVRIYFADGSQMKLISYMILKAPDGKYKIDQSNVKTGGQFYAEPW